MNKCKRWYGEKHNWGKWSIKKRNDIFSTEWGVRRMVGEMIIQERQCLDCGKTEIDTKEIFV